MKVWITKYALTKGLFEADAEIIDGKYARTKGAYGLFTSAWEATREKAVRAARSMRDRKVASLQKQITKLQAMEF